MTNFAPVGPLAILRSLPLDVLGEYHLCIAPKVLEAPIEYSTFFQHTDFIIMDNGVVELGYPLDVRDLYRAAVVVGAKVVILPDTINDGKMTVKQAKQNAPAYRELSKGTGLMGVVQGTTLEECLECATGLREAGVDWFGVSKYSTPNLGSRVELVQRLAAEYHLPIHVLGFSENMEDDMLAATASPMVTGIDAATPLWYGRDQSSIFPTDPPTVAGYGPRPVDYWHRLRVAGEAGSSFEAEYNVKTVRRWLAAASHVRTVAEELAAHQGQQPHG